MSAAVDGAEARSAGERQAAGRWGAVAFFSLLFFLASADQVFATRLGGMNFRWAQILLLAGATAALASAAPHLLSVDGRKLRLVAAAWLLFFLAYGAAALLSAEPRLSVVKLVWAVFNIGGAGALCLATRRREGLETGLVVGLGLAAGVVWVDAAWIYSLGHSAPLLGLVQQSMEVDSMRQLRPHAFYYEPSYAGAGLAFATPLVFVAARRFGARAQVGVAALVSSAVVLTTARTGGLTLVIAGLGAAAALGLRREWGLLRRLGAVVAVATVLLALFFAVGRGPTYLKFITGPLGPGAMIERASYDPPKPSAGEPAVILPSESDRLSNLRSNLERWAGSPVTGWGVSIASDRHGVARLIEPVAMNTWAEILVESGALGFGTFILALILTLRYAARRSRDRTLLAIVAAGWAGHLLGNLSFTQTFPRLDYWLLLFCSVRLVSEALPEPAFVIQPDAVTGTPASPVTAPAAAIAETLTPGVR